MRTIIRAKANLLSLDTNDCIVEVKKEIRVSRKSIQQQCGE